ncbi:hypothetical protein J2Y03_003332 [Neobacillus niacini]|uniref:hypothetical protein n=1 Tax=Neobacillus niacini TaxID=86668 RepID=UPI00285F34D7|nr:hypothetical protein [Neobacillus niacini]MDR7078282.1 hypothetical protein [Neobacillus niacini]
MKKELLLVASAFFLMSVTAITGVHAFEEKAKTVTISKQESDVTGDGINESIQLKGVLYDGEDDYLKDIYINISTDDDKQYTMPLESGSKASLKLVDLNKDGVKDLFANVFTGGSGGITLNYLYSFKDFISKELAVPDPLEIDSQFEDGYKARIKIDLTGNSYLFDLNDRKKYYKKLGLYYKGKLNEPMELTVNSFHSLKPVKLKSGEFILKGAQRITGIANADTIAFVESSWNFGGGKWNLNSASVHTNIQSK